MLDPITDLKFGASDETFGSSYSQVDTYEQCPRKWAWRWREKLDIKNKFATQGIEAHGHMEKWHKLTVLPPTDTISGRLASALIAHVPPPQAVHRDNVELAAILQIGGINFYMGIDLFVPDTKPPTVFDHKTTTQVFDKKEPNGLRPYILTPERMGSDVQASLYAAWALTQTKASSVRVQWTYAQKKGAPKTDENGVILAQSKWQPKTHVVSAELRGKDIQDRVSQSIETAREMKLIVEEGAGALDLPYNAAACSAYGGCPYQSMCNLTPQQQLESLMTITGNKEDLKARLAARKSGNGAAAPAPAINPPAPAAAPATGSSLSDRLAARKAVQQEPEAAPVAEAAAPEPVEKKTRGRPKKKSTENPRLVVATEVYSALLNKFEVGELADGELAGDLSDLAVTYADALIGKCK